MFKVDHGKASNLLPEGTYEAVVYHARMEYTMSGREYIGIEMIIRNDVEQPRQNSHIYYQLWPAKNPKAEDLACGGFLSWQIQALSKSCGLENGREYGSLEEWFDDLATRPLIVDVRHEEYDGKTRARVKYTDITKHPEFRHQWDKETGFAEIEDDDCPF